MVNTVRLYTIDIEESNVEIIHYIYRGASLMIDTAV